MKSSKEAQTPLARAELEQLGLVGLGLIHEMGNPITATMLGLELLREQVDRGDMTDPATISDQLGRQIDRVRKMAALLSRFRQWVRQEEPFIEKLDAVDITHGVVRMLRASLEATGRCVPIVVPPPRDIPMVDADHIFLERALTCVLMNASEAVSAQRSTSGEVRVSFWENEDCIGIVVDDNGPGFPSIDRALALGDTTKSDGLGVGLPLVQRMLSLMGGELHLANRPTPGASVTLTLPRSC